MKPKAGNIGITLGMGSQVFTALASILSTQAEVMEELVRLGEQKTKAITENRARELEALAESELKQAEKLNHIEQQRVSLVSALEEQAAKEVEHPVRFTLTELVQLAPPKEREVLQALYHRLGKLVARLAQLSDLNQRLLAHSLAVVNFSLEMLSGGPSVPAIYDRPGKPKDTGGSPRVLDAKV